MSEQQEPRALEVGEDPRRKSKFEKMAVNFWDGNIDQAHYVPATIEFDGENLILAIAGFETSLSLCGDRLQMDTFAPPGSYGSDDPVQKLDLHLSDRMGRTLREYLQLEKDAEESLAQAFVVVNPQ